MEDVPLERVPEADRRQHYEPGRGVEGAFAARDEIQATHPAARK